MVDDIQLGCGRTGSFFSFETAGIVPDIVCLSKSPAGTEYDVWKPDEHNDTFRGYNPAFVTRARALGLFWSDRALENRTTALGERVRRALTGTARRHGLAAPRGRGLGWGLPAGPHDEVAKVFPPLNVADEHVEQGLGMLDEAVASVVGGRTLAA